MSESIDRVQLNELEEDLVVGGQLRYENMPGQNCYNVYSDENPDVRYSIPHGQVMYVKLYERNDLKGLSDAQKLATLVEEGKIFPI